MLTRMAPLLARMARLLTRMARMLTRMTRWLAYYTHSLHCGAGHLRDWLQGQLQLYFLFICRTVKKISHIEKLLSIFIILPIQKVM